MLAIHCGHNGILNGKEFEFVQQVIEEMGNESNKSKELNELNEFNDSNELNELKDLNELNQVNELNDSNELNGAFGSSRWNKSMKRRTREEEFGQFTPIEMKSMSKDESDYDLDNDKEMIFNNNNNE